MTPPTPAAVRAALKISQYVEPDNNEKRGYMTDPRHESSILHDHIRAICAEMRSVIPHGSKVTLSEAVHASVLNAFADKLEGREP